MEKERQIEQQLTDRFGRRTPFLVPDGYFDSCVEQVMQRLPQRQPAVQHPLKKRHIVRWVASICAVVFSVGIYLYFFQSRDADNDELLSTRKSVLPIHGDAEGQSSLDEAADCMMCGEQEFYAFVSDNE